MMIPKNLTPSGAALIIVDVQNDFCPGGALTLTDGDISLLIRIPVTHQTNSYLSHKVYYVKLCGTM